LNWKNALSLLLILLLIGQILALFTTDFSDEYGQGQLTGKIILVIIIGGILLILQRKK